MAHLNTGVCRQSSVQPCYFCCQGCSAAGHVFLCELHTGEQASAACCLPDNASWLAPTVPALSLQLTASPNRLALIGGVLVQTVVFCNSKLDAHWLAEYLTAQGYKAAFLSGDCPLCSHRRHQSCLRHSLLQSDRKAPLDSQWNFASALCLCSVPVSALPCGVHSQTAAVLMQVHSPRWSALTPSQRCGTSN